MTVTLEKDSRMLRYAQVRTPDNGAAYDIFAWEKATAPLWWDDWSYARYQADDGPTGYWEYELAFLPEHSAPIVKRWVSFNDDYCEPDYRLLPRSESRKARELWHSFGAQIDALRESGEADRFTIYIANPIPF